VKVLICDYCYDANKSLVEAVDVIPETVMTISKRRIRELGVCAKHGATTFPDFTSATKGIINQSLPEIVPDGGGYLTTKQVAAKFGVKLNTLSYYVAQKKITPAGRYRNSLVFDVTDKDLVTTIKELQAKVNGKSKVERKKTR
jgi:hypothetical protein